MDKELSPTATAVLVVAAILMLAGAVFMLAPAFFEGLAIYINATVGAAFSTTIQSALDSVTWLGSLVGLG